MNAHFPGYDTYRELYARNYRGRKVAEHLELAGSLTNLAILDLCGGDGCLSLAALPQHPGKVVLVDEQEGMIPPEVESNPAIQVLILGAEDFLSGYDLKEGAFDRIFCRQAVNYWFNDRSAAQLAHVLSSEGIFIFNTFNQKPPVQPQIHTYKLAGREYVEVSWLVSDQVHHLQMCEGMPGHYSWCSWIPREAFFEQLTPYFKVDLLERGKADLYACTKK